MKNIWIGARKMAGPTALFQSTMAIVQPFSSGAMKMGKRWLVNAQTVEYSMGTNA